MPGATPRLPVLTIALAACAQPGAVAPLGPTAHCGQPAGTGRRSRRAGPRIKKAPPRGRSSDAGTSGAP